jgi:hypothetical protein
VSTEAVVVAELLQELLLLRDCIKKNQPLNPSLVHYDTEKHSSANLTWLRNVRTFVLTFNKAGNIPNSEFQQTKFCPLRKNTVKLTSKCSHILGGKELHMKTKKINNIKKLKVYVCRRR